MQNAIFAFANEGRRFLDGHTLDILDTTVINYIDGNGNLIRGKDVALVATIAGSRIVNLKDVLGGQGRTEMRDNQALSLGKAVPWLPKAQTLVALERATDKRPWRLVEIDRASGKPGSALAMPSGVPQYVGFAFAETPAVINANFGVGELDLTFGTSTLFEGTPGLAAGTAVGNEVWALLREANTVAVYRGDRTFERAIQLDEAKPLRAAGLASDGTTLFIASQADGAIHLFDLKGKRTGKLESKAAAGSLAGLAYDAASKSLWLAVRGATAELRQFDLTGKLLASVPTSGLDIVALQVTPANYKPKPPVRR